MDLCDAVEAVFGDDYRHVNKMLMISLRMIDDVQRKRRKHIKSEELKTTVFWIKANPDSGNRHRDGFRTWHIKIGDIPSVNTLRG
jgi:hypothetical protein